MEQSRQRSTLVEVATKGPAVSQLERHVRPFTILRMIFYPGTGVSITWCHISP